MHLLQVLVVQQTHIMPSQPLPISPLILADPLFLNDRILSRYVGGIPTHPVPSVVLPHLEVYAQDVVGCLDAPAERK